MSIAEDLRNSLKNSISGITKIKIRKEILYPSSGYLVYNSENKNWLLAEPIQVYKNGILILTGYTVSNDATTKYGKVTFLVAQAASDKIEATYNYEVYTNTDIDNFLTDACKECGSLLLLGEDKYILADLVSTDPLSLIESIARIKILKDFLSKAYNLVNTSIGEATIEKNQLFRNIREMIDEEKNNYNKLLNSNRVFMLSDSGEDVKSYRQYYEDKEFYV